MIGKPMLFDVAKYVAQKSNDKYVPIGYKELVVLQGPNGVIVTDNEACHEFFTNMDEMYDIEACDAPVVDENGFTTIPLFPQYIIRLSIRDMLVLCDTEVVSLGKWIRTFGSRIESNYRILLASIEDIGLNPDDYPRRG